MGEFRNRRAIHIAFAVATVALVLFGIYGPVATAAVGWLSMLAVVIGWLVFSIVEIRRQKQHTK